MINKGKVLRDQLYRELYSKPYGTMFPSQMDIQSTCKLAKLKWRDKEIQVQELNTQAKD